MGLKYEVLSKMGYSIELKSDQNGIEMVVWSLVWPPPGSLKSDQNGIEIKEDARDLEEALLVKIRPKWDWNGHSWWY